MPEYFRLVYNLTGNYWLGECVVFVIANCGVLCKAVIDIGENGYISLFTGYILQGSKTCQKIITGDIENKGHKGHSIE